jgi:hypothetical protein
MLRFVNARLHVRVLNRLRRWGHRRRDGRSMSRLDRLRPCLDYLIFEILSGNLVKRAGGNLGACYAQFLGPGKDFLALDAELLGDVVDTNGHIVSNRSRSDVV